MKKFFIFFDSSLAGVMGILISAFRNCKVETIGVFNKVEIFRITGKEKDIIEAKKASAQIRVNHFLTESVNV